MNRNWLLRRRQEAGRRGSDSGRGDGVTTPEDVDATTTLAGGPADPTSSVITFSQSNFDVDGSPSGRIFEWTNKYQPPKDFDWKRNQAVHLKSISLIHIKDKNQNHSVKTQEFYEAAAAIHDNSLFVNTDQNSTGLNLDAFYDKTGRVDISLDDIVAVQLNWTKDGQDYEGMSVSPFFAVIDGNSPSKATTRTKIQEQIASFSSRADGYQYPTDDNNNNPGAGTGDSGSTSVHGPITGTSDSGGSSGHSGLSPGAIAGIAVGAFVFLCIIGVLAFFLIRRRRKSQARGGHGDQQASNAYIVDKDAAHDPNSPYSDDGRSNQNTPLGPSSHNLHGGDDHDIPPYQDDSRQHDASSGSGTHTPSQGVTHNVAHLVEEGMTEADIRRLEEEERQLDDEIERAGRR